MYIYPLYFLNFPHAKFCAYTDMLRIKSLAFLLFTFLQISFDSKSGNRKKAKYKHQLTHGRFVLGKKIRNVEMVSLILIAYRQ